MHTATTTSHPTHTTPVTKDISPRTGVTPTRRNLGAFYTPPEVVDMMVSQLVNLGPTSVVLEPSGGDGAFVAGLLGTQQVSPSQIHVWDINANVRAEVEKWGVSFTCRDGLLGTDTTHTTAPTHVIGNPPYLNKASDYVKHNRTQLRKKYAQVVGASETYTMFTYAALEELAPGGQVVFCISDTWMTLNSHRKFRRYLLGHTIRSVTALPASVFPDASVHTVIVDVVKQPAPANHVVHFRDYRTLPTSTGDNWWEQTPLVTSTPQKDLLIRGGHEFLFNPAQAAALDVAAACATPLLSTCDGGLGMFTTDNQRFLRHVWRGEKNATPAGHIHTSDVDGKQWRWYHKKGGSTAWYAPVDSAVRWDAHSRAHYSIPTSCRAAAEDTERDGFVVAGISGQLTARVAHPGALWDSNKAFVFHPHPREGHPVGFYLAVLNSSWYRLVASAVNHTASVQLRNLTSLPMLPFTTEEIRTLSQLGDRAVSLTRNSPTPDMLAPVTAQIDDVVNQAVARVHSRLHGSHDNTASMAVAA